MQTKTKIKFITLLSTLGMMSSAVAWEWSPLVAARVGAAWVDVDNGGHVEVNDTVDEVDKFFGDHNESTADWGAFVGAEWEVTEKVLLQGGISYDYLNSVDLEGDVWQFNDPELDNYDYKYEVQHQRLSLEGKLLYEYDDWFPFVIASIGNAWNRTSDYKDISDDPDVNPVPSTPTLEGETESSFTWSVGAGIERSFGEHWRLGLNYLYTDAGDASLRSERTGDELDVDLSVQSVVLQVSYFL